MSIEILAFTPADYDAALALWQRAEGIGLSEADSRPNIELYLQRNPGMSFVARSEGRLVGAVLCGHDGRRGYLHHLAVDPSVRRLGLGRRLAEAALAALKDAGIHKCHLFLFNRNEAGLSFWSALGWERRGDLCIVSKEISANGTKCPC
jgi:putative acetyltransferase